MKKIIGTLVEATLVLLTVKTIRKHAWKDGYCEGSEDGYKNGYSEGTKDLANYVLDELDRQIKK